jgi:hypothetical protein
MRIAPGGYLAGYVLADPHLSRLADEAFRLEAYVATGLIDAGEPFRGSHPRRRQRAASGRLE